jgi:hypothetical protein
MTGDANLIDDSLRLGGIACGVSGRDRYKCDNGRDKTIHERSPIYCRAGHHFGPDQTIILA